MKKLCLLVCVCLLAALALVACQNGEEQPTHTHTYADTWSFDQDSHWYAATCEHTEEKANVALHTDAENDGVCDVCAYGSDHTHTYAEAWSSDGENHWYAAACGHDVKDALGTHEDANNDDLCDVCGHSGGCEHPAAADALLSDAQGHWYGVTCGHNIKLMEAAHEDGNNDGVCDVCAWEDPDHTHTYKTEYAYDGQSHWFDADCGHTLKGNQEAHVDDNNDGACDICPWNDGCTHEYSTLWSVDGTNHWHAVVCTHTIAPADQSAHADMDDDGACDVCGYLDHDHTFDNSVWVFDKSSHWHSATCGCTLKADASAHVDADNNGACDVCEWNDGCEHPLQNEFSYDNTYHWHGVSCSHTIAPTDQVLHKDPDLDGVCNVCGYYDQTHTHTFSNTLTVDADSHYYAATCEHTGARKDEQAHVDDNMDNKCDVCGGIVSMQVVIDQITTDASTEKVSNGTVISTSTYHFEDSTEPYVSVETITYTFGTGYLHTNDGIYDRWFTLLDDGSVFAARMIDGEYESEFASADNMAGYYFNGHFLYYNVEAYGIESLLYNLYTYAQSNAININVRYDATTGAYGFDFTYYNGYESLYCITVWFLYNSENVITDMTISSMVYASYEQYEDGSYYPADGAAPDYEYELVIKQTVGERTAVNEHGPENFLFASYDFADQNGKVYGDTIYLNPGEMIYLYFANVQPATATTKLDTLNVTSSGKSSQIYSYVAWSGDYVCVKGIAAGTYTLTITSTNMTKTVTIVVGTPELLSLTPMVYYKDYSGLYSTLVGNTYTIYVGQTLYFGALANPSAADDDFDAMCNDGELSSTMITYGGEDTYVHSFTAADVGTYTIILISTDDPDITTTLTVTVEPIPTISEILNGKYMASIYDYNVSSYSSCDILVTFAPASAGATNGTVTVVRNDQTEVLSYNYVDGEIVLVHVSGEVLGYTLSLGDQYSVVIGWTYDSTQKESVMLEYNYTNRVFAKTWVSESETVYDLYSFTFVFGDQGYVFDGANGSYVDMLTQVDNATGAITVTFLDDVDGTDLAEIQSITLNPDANTISLVLADRTVTLTPAAY